MNEFKIQVKNVNKSFGGQAVLKQITMDLKQGNIYGIIGRNGSGKTVLMKCICGLLKTDSGSILIDEKDIEKCEEVTEKFGIIIETPGFFGNYSAMKNLYLLSRIRNKCSKERIREVLTTVGLDYNSPKKVSQYSMGMKQRLGIAQAIMEYPEILLLDEPMNGLDNQGVLEMRTLFLQLRKEGKLIVLASHNREDIEVLCDEVFEMDAGILTKAEKSFHSAL